MDNILAYFDARPVTTGIAGGVGGFVGWFINHLKLFGEVASSLAVIFGCVSAFFAMLLVIHRFINRNKK